MNRLKRVEQDKRHGFDCCLYVIALTGTPFCKIGISKNPVRRLAEIQTSNPLPAEVVALYGGTQTECFEIEQAALMEVDAYRRSGEWVEMPPESVCRVIERQRHMDAGSGSLRDTVRINLFALMQARGMSQVDVAAASGVGQTTVSKIVRGGCSPSVDTVELIAGALRVPPLMVFQRGLHLRLQQALDALDSSPVETSIPASSSQDIARGVG